MTVYIAHSNRATLLRDGAMAVLVTDQKEGTVEYRRAGAIHTASMASVWVEDYVARVYAQPTTPQPAFEEIAEGIACIHIDRLTCGDDKELGDFLSRYDKLIIDLREYPADYFVLHRLLPKYFFSEARCAVQTLLPQAKLPGTVLRKDIMTAETSDPSALFQGQIVLLVNAETQSMGEYFTMFLQTNPNAVTLGSQTAGADGDITNIQLPYARFNLTGLGILYPDGTHAQRQGVKIDIPVERTAEGLMKGRDEQLQAAVDYLRGDNISLK